MERTAPVKTIKRKKAIIPWHSTKKKYTPDMPDRVYHLALLGATELQMQEALHIGKSTFEMWVRNKEEFRDAVQKGKLEADARVANALYQKAVGYRCTDTQVFVYKGQVIKVPIIKQYPPDTGAACFWLKNRTRSSANPWVDVSKHEFSGTVNMPVDFNKLDLKDFTDEQLKVLLEISPKLRAPGIEEKEQ